MLEVLIESGRAMAEAGSCWPLTAEARVRAQVNPCGICGGRSVTGTGFSPSSSVSPVNIFPLSLSILIYHLGINNMSGSGSSSETYSHPIEIYSLLIESSL
jgi:hypothetical protein